MTGTSDSDGSNIGEIDDGADPESLKMRFRARSANTWAAHEQSRMIASRATS